MDAVPIVIGYAIVVAEIVASAPEVLCLVISDSERLPLPVSIAVHRIAKLNNHIVLNSFSLLG